MIDRNHLDMNYINECFHYYDGDLFWKIRPRYHFENEKAWTIINSRCAGKKVGTIDPSTGYRRVRFDRKAHLIHRVIFAMFNRDCPDLIDHIDGDINNNRIENLRPVNYCQSNQNSKLRIDNKSGIRCVAFRRGKWIVQVRKDKKRVVAKQFEDKELAEFVATEAISLYHGEYARRIS